MATTVQETKKRDEGKWGNKADGEVLWMLVHQRANSKAPLLGLESTEKGDIFKNLKWVSYISFLLSFLLVRNVYSNFDSCMPRNSEFLYGHCDTTSGATDSSFLCNICWESYYSPQQCGFNCVAKGHLKHSQR